MIQQIPFKRSYLKSVGEAMEAVRKLAQNPHCNVKIVVEFFRWFSKCFVDDFIPYFYMLKTILSLTLCVYKAAISGMPYAGILQKCQLHKKNGVRNMVYTKRFRSEATQKFETDCHCCKNRHSMIVYSE